MTSVIDNNTGKENVRISQQILTASVCTNVFFTSLHQEFLVIDYGIYSYLSSHIHCAVTWGFPGLYLASELQTTQES